MTDRDPAFLWETEALRTSPARTHPAPDRADGDLVTLREAHDATGIPVNTLRKWARRETIESHLDLTVDPPLRLVRMSDIVRRARELGRDARPESPRRRSDRSSRPQGEADVQPTGSPTPPSPAVPDGTLLVPVAAWDKMLQQLGNLHQAGQDLAEARERAAKAETEASFLRDRLAEMRRELAEVQQPRSTRDRLQPPEAAGDMPSPETNPPGETRRSTPDTPLGPSTGELVRRLYRTWRLRRR